MARELRTFSTALVILLLATLNLPRRYFPCFHWDIDTHGLSIPSSVLIAACHSFPCFLHLVTPFVRDRCLFAYRYRRCGVATCSFRYFHRGRLFHFREPIDRTIVQAPPSLARGDFAIFIALESRCGEDFAFTLQPGQQAAGVAHACPVLFKPHPQSNSWPRAPFSCYLGNHCVFFFDFFDRLFYCANTRVPATPSLTRYRRPPPLTRTQRLPPFRRAVATAGASSIPSGHSLLAISRQPPSSGAATCRMNCGRGRVAPGVEVCRCNGGLWVTGGSGHTQGPFSSDSASRCRRRRCWRARARCRRDPRILPASRPGIPRIHLRFPLLLYPGLLLRWYRRGPFGPRPYQRLLSPPHALRTANAASHRQREQRSYSLGGYYCAKQYLAVIPRNHGPLFLFLNSLLLVHI
ncbi:uncharacterized protein [Drosophila suzukii]|uniref:Uncharacterized protein n=1 Tax=Drosophila suzukii TaxID=28584 RepID=A0ABM4TWT5_DROSZ